MLTRFSVFFYVQLQTSCVADISASHVFRLLNPRDGTLYAYAYKPDAISFENEFVNFIFSIDKDFQRSG